MFSLVMGVPFSPLDLDLGHLARGEWNAAVDRFRVWYLPRGEGGNGPVCYVMVRKFDLKEEVLVCGHLVVNLDEKGGARDKGSFTVGILSNDEVRAQAMLRALLDIPPSYHKRREVKTIERRWRKDPQTVMRFLANVHSVLANSASGPGGKVYTLKIEPPPEALAELKRGMSSWWED